MPLPQKLLTLYETPEYDGSGVTDLQNIVFKDGDLTLHISSYTYEDKEHKPLQVVLEFRNVVEFEITEESWDFFIDQKEHALLTSYATPRSVLYIKQTPDKLETAFAQSITALDKMVPKGQEGVTVLGLTASRLLSHLSRGHGIVAGGPKVFIDIIFEILKVNGACPYTLIASPKSKSWIIDGTHGSTPYEKERMRLMTFGINWILYEEED